MVPRRHHTFKVGEASTWVVEVVVGEVVRDSGKAIEATDEVMKTINEAREVPRVDMGATREITEVLEAGGGTITVVDQVASEVCEASGEASDAHRERTRIVSGMLFSLFELLFLLFFLFFNDRMLCALSKLLFF